MDYGTDENGTPRPLGICLTAELSAENLEAAEDAALDVGRRFSLVLSTYSGSPLQQPKLKRLGRIGDSKGLFEQFEYYYLEGADALPRVMLRSYDLEKLISWFGALDEQTAYRLELAARWYGISVGSEDPLDGYLAVWIGLESVGPAIGSHMHPNGPKVSCPVCQNESGIDRDRGKAGIEHSIKKVAPELLKIHTFEELKGVRDSIAHGGEPAEPLRFSAKGSLADLQLALIFSIITAARPESATPGAGRAILPRNFSVYPDGRAAVRSPVELIYHKPYYGEWLQVDRRYRDPKSRIESDGNYIWGAKIGVKVQGKFTSDSHNLVQEYVIFDRLGRSWQNLESDEELPSIPVITWRDIALSPAWQQYLLPQEGESD